MLFSLNIVAGCSAAERRVVPLWPTKRRAVPSAPGVATDTSPRFGCCLETKVAIRELAGNVEASNFFAHCGPLPPVFGSHRGTC
jgi:hypothetical protein